MKEIDNDTNRWKDTMFLLTESINIIKTTILLKANYRFNALKSNTILAIFSVTLNLAGR